MSGASAATSGQNRCVPQAQMRFLCREMIKAEVATAAAWHQPSAYFFACCIFKYGGEPREEGNGLLVLTISKKPDHPSLSRFYLALCRQLRPSPGIIAPL